MKCFEMDSDLWWKNFDFLEFPLMKRMEELENYCESDTHKIEYD